MNPVLTQRDLHECFKYEPETGNFFRLKGRFANADKPCGSRRPQGYWQISHNYGVYLAHRLAWLYVYGESPQYVIDHIDGDKLNNRIANLRDVPQVVNTQNRKRPQTNNKVGLLGVTRNRKKGTFAAHVSIYGKATHIGVFPSAEEAHEAYLNAKRAAHVGCTL